MGETNLSSTIEMNISETLTAMMFYTKESLVWGEILHHESVLPSRILVGVTVPEFISVFNAKMIFLEPNFISNPVSHSEIHIPAKKIIGYHLMPPHEDQIDYDPSEPNRKMQPMTVFLGPFTVKGSIRISGLTTVKSNLEVTKSEFMALYDLQINHTHQREMKPIHAKMGYFRVRENIFAV